MKSLLCVLCLLLCTSRLASAEPTPLVPVPPGDDKISPLKEKQLAPFAGQLFDTPTALRWANYLQQCHFRLEADVDYQKRLDQVDVTLLQRKLELADERYDGTTKALQNENTDLRGRLAALENPPFYKTVWFGVGVGVVGVGLVALGTVAMLHVTK